MSTLGGAPVSQRGVKDPASGAQVAAVRDGDRERPIPTAWRPVLRDIVSAFAKFDYRLQAGVNGVARVSEDTAAQIRGFISSYGATLVELPNETWDSSVCIWYGDHWSAMVDLWTESEGRSDMVLQVRAVESTLGFTFKIELVYVP
jgi:hypothetical protein